MMPNPGSLWSSDTKPLIFFVTYFFRPGKINDHLFNKKHVFFQYGLVSVMAQLRNTSCADPEFENFTY